MTTSDGHEKPALDKPLARGAAGASIERTPSYQKPKNMNGPLYMQTAGHSNVVLVRRVRGKDDSSWRLFTRWMVENQIGKSCPPPKVLPVSRTFPPLSVRSQSVPGPHG